MRILIADDEMSTRRLLQLMLEPYGQCELVENGKEAVAAATAARTANQPYDLICLDIMMPEMDGQDALKAIRSQEKSLGIADGEGSHIIMVTCVDSPNAVIEAYYKGGCSSFLVKPVRKETLRRILCDLNLIEL